MYRVLVEATFVAVRLHCPIVRSRKIFLHRFGILLMSLLACLAQPVAASTVGVLDPDQAPAGKGVPLHQRFLESGASIVSTEERRYCVVSRRIDIAKSDYQTSDGAVVPWDEVIRSPAASTQAMADLAGMMGFRVQLKYSPVALAGIFLFIGDTSEDVRELLEPSTDSLRFGGDLAVRLDAAFRSGTPVRVVAQSRDTGRRVGDTLAPPDLKTLDACQTELADLPDTGLPPMANLISLDFDASPDPASLATLEQMHACGMKPTDASLHLGRIRSVTGFFSHTDKVFVTFDKSGLVDRVYVPGLLDAGFGGGASGEAHVSRSADLNVPDTENKVTGCIGASAMQLCRVPLGGANGHRLQVCDSLLENETRDEIALLAPLSGIGPLGSGSALGNEPGSNIFGQLASSITEKGQGAISDGLPPSPAVVPPFIVEEEQNTSEVVVESEPAEVPLPSPVPLPPGGVLLLAGVGAMAALRRWHVKRSLAVQRH